MIALLTRSNNRDGGRVIVVRTVAELHASEFADSSEAAVLLGLPTTASVGGLALVRWYPGETIDHALESANDEVHQYRHMWPGHESDPG